jgi:hypothetical protein
MLARLALNSWTQVILLPQNPEYLELQVCSATLSLLKALLFIQGPRLES